MLDIKLKLRPGHSSERSWMEPSPLKALFWNVTYACNYRCKICFTDAGARRRDELTTTEAKAVIDDAHASGINDIIISGGEPFMRGDLLQILQYMAKRGISARIASNGSLITRDILKQLKNTTCTKSFQISIDTLDSDLYDEIHGTPSGTLDKVLRHIGLIQEHGFHTTVSVRLTPETLNEIPRLLDFAHAEGWATVTIHCPVHSNRVENAFPQDADVISLLEPALEHYINMSEKWLMETYIPWIEYHPLIRRLEKRVKIVHRGCRAGRDRLTINPSGDLSPCVCMDDERIYVGNVRKDRLIDVFQNSLICDMFRNPWKYGICVDCPNVMHCGAGCRAAALALTGKIDGEDKSCPFWQRRTAREVQKHGAS